MSSISEANKTMHPAETGSWAHKKLSEAGFSTNTPPQIGFVRTYEYTHDDGTEIKVHIGAPDYWDGTDSDGNDIPTYYGGRIDNEFSMLYAGLYAYLDTREEK